MSPYFREMVLLNTPKNAFKFVCEDCHFKCCKRSDYERHLNTAKHKMVTNGDKNTPNGNTKHICCCGKEFKYRQGLSRHKKNCLGIQTDIVSATTTPVSNTNSSINNDTVNAILQDNAEMRKILVQQQEQMKEQQEQINKQHEQHNKQIQDLIPQLQQVTNINNNNCNNKFNLNFFLNEQCKDAISIQHFIENLNIGIRELEHMGDVGYVKGMMSIFSETLGKMDIYKRP